MTIKQKQNLRIGNLFKIGRRARNAGKSWWSILNAVLYIFAFMGGIYFLASINDLSIKGFKLQELKAEAAALNKEKDDLELSIMRLESFDDLIARARVSKMVKVDKIEYISAVSGEVAKK